MSMALKYSFGVEMQGEMPEDNLEHVILRGTWPSHGGVASVEVRRQSDLRERETGEGEKGKEKRKNKRRARAGRAGAYRDVRDVRLRRRSRADMSSCSSARRIFERLAFPGGGRRVHPARGAPLAPHPEPASRQSTCFIARDLDSRHARLHPGDTAPARATAPISPFP